MSTDIKTDLPRHSLTEYYGGDERGICVQITALKMEDGDGYITLSSEEAEILIKDLKGFVKREKTRRKKRQYPPILT